ncbi:hypothetical protein GGR58DRAFT_510954 [Xylaria digitata]|nr:hypothetical protein GGR58DRAFT_510954 [Xylaria digitata]
MPAQVEDKSKTRPPNPNSKTEKKQPDPSRNLRPLSSTTGRCSPTPSADDDVDSSKGLKHKGDCFCVQRPSDSITNNETSTRGNLCYSNLNIPSRDSVPGSILSHSSACSTDESTTSSDYEDDIAFDSNQSILAPLTEPLLGKLISAYFCDAIGRGSEQEETEKTNDRGVSDSAIFVTSEQHTGTGQNSTKRKREDLSQGRDGGEDEDEEPAPPEKKQAVPLKEGALLACPFAKWNPLSYHSCYKYIMKDIRRVKQHLRRNHKRPLYCPTCWNTFKDEQTFYSHIESRACLPRPKVELEGLTTTQQESLERKVDRKLSKSDQWYSIFSILFPNSPRPESAYLESNLSAELLSFQKFMAVDGLEIVEQTAREQIPADLIPQTEEIVVFSQVLFQQAIPKILKKYEVTNPHISSPDSGYGTLSNVPINSRSIPDGHKVDDWKGVETIPETKNPILEEPRSAPNATFSTPIEPIITSYDSPGAFLENLDTFGVGGNFAVDWDRLWGEEVSGA